MIENDDGRDIQQTEARRTHLTYEDYLNARKITFKDVRSHLTGPVVSVIFHIILLSIMGAVVVFKAPEEKKDVNVVVSEVDIKSFDKMLEPPPPPQDVSNEISVDIDRPVTDSIAVSGLDSSGPMAVGSASALTISLPDLTGIAPAGGGSGVKLPEIFKARTTVEARKAALKKYKADPRNESALDKALQWLADNQNPDGSWGVYQPTKQALTGYALLAFLGRGETPQSQKYGQTIIKAIKVMTDWAKQSGPNRYIGDGWSYSHPILAYAISEAYGITKMPKVKEAMDITVGYIVNRMNKRGTFSYAYDMRPRVHDRDPLTGRMHRGVDFEPPSDLSFAGWNYQALKAAFAAGCEVPGINEAVDKAVKGIKWHYHKSPPKAAKKEEGGFAIGPGGQPDFGMTCAGILCLGLLGDGNSPESRKSFDWLKTVNKEGMAECSWRYKKDVHEKYEKAFTFALYTWYYQTQVLFQFTKGMTKDWHTWNDSFSKTYLDEQEKDGSWLTPAEKYGKSVLDAVKSNAEWSHVKSFADIKDLKIYATALNSLTLEVYYRYLPTYQLVKAQPVKKASQDDDLGLIIK